MTYNLLSAVIFQSTTDATGKKYDNFAELLRVRNTLANNLHNIIDGKQKTQLNSLVTRLNQIFDEALAQEFGAKVIPSRSGRGAVPDNLRINDGTISENKNVIVGTSVGANGSLIIEKARGISLTSGIKLKELQSVYTGYSAKTKQLETTPVNFKGKLLNQLVDLSKKNQTEIKSFLAKTRNPNVIALKKNFELKQNDIKTALVFGGTTHVASIGWTWKQILAPRSGAAVVLKKVVDKDGTVTDVQFNIVFSEALVTKALRKAIKQGNIKAIAAPNGIIDIYNRVITKSGVPPTLATIAAIDRLFSTVYTTRAVKGSVKVYSVNLSARFEESKPIQRQKFISGVQISALVQRKLESSMATTGAARPWKLKNRTNTFIKSVQVFPNYKTQTMKYLYNPVYKSLEAYGYDPDKQVEGSLRAVLRERYMQQFNLVRG